MENQPLSKRIHVASMNPLKMTSESMTAAVVAARTCEVSFLRMALTIHRIRQGRNPGREGLRSRLFSCKDQT